MNSNLGPINIKSVEKASHYEDAGTLLSRIGDRDFVDEFRKINNMGKNSKVWFLVNTGGIQFLGQVIRLYNSWKVTVFDNRIGDASMTPIAKFIANDRFELEELMYSMYFELTEYAEAKNRNDEDEKEKESY